MESVKMVFFGIVNVCNYVYIFISSPLLNIFMKKSYLNCVCIEDINVCASVCFMQIDPGMTEILTIKQD